MSMPASGSGGQEAGKPEGGTFGIDAPTVPAVLGVAALLLAVIGCLLMITHEFAPGLVAVIFAIFVGLCALSYLYTTVRGKFVCWADLLDDARLKGDEYAVDLGCGRGAVLISFGRDNCGIGSSWKSPHPARVRNPTSTDPRCGRAFSWGFVASRLRFGGSALARLERFGPACWSRSRSLRSSRCASRRRTRLGSRPGKRGEDRQRPAVRR